MSDKKEKVYDIEFSTDIRKIKKDGMVEVSDTSKPTNPPGLRPVNSNPQPQGQQGQPSTDGGETTGGENN